MEAALYAAARATISAGRKLPWPDTRPSGLNEGADKAAAGDEDDEDVDISKSHEENTI